MKSNQKASFLRFTLSFIFVIMIVAGYFAYHWYNRSSKRTTRLLTFLRNPEKHQDWTVSAKSRCGNAPFLMPTDGYIGYLWDDSFRPGHRHQGIDIFGGSEAGVTPVFAAYSGYLTRLPEWKSSVIIRIPKDPLNNERQIWTYYTHMADSKGNSFIVAAFPPGSSEVFVEAGTTLGYQGNFSGNPNNPVGVHLHFSIVLSKDDGIFENELLIKNTLDPSPYFGYPLNANLNRGEIPLCNEE
ncbi:MAG: M23 family metallopeptidase [Anaerolineales bacterium]|nr:M23 family metallopeptidase [Anaerolineales bacterium]